MLDNSFHRRKEISKMLLSGKSLTVRQLRELFSVGRRTIERDMAVLGQYYPIVSSRGYNGGFHIVPGPTEYQDTLSEEQLNCLYNLLESCDVSNHLILLSIIREFGPYIKSIEKFFACHSCKIHKAFDAIADDLLCIF